MSQARWVENDARWFELRLLYCDLCGKVIPKHLWQVEMSGGLWLSSAGFGEPSLFDPTP